MCLRRQVRARVAVRGVGQQAARAASEVLHTFCLALSGLPREGQTLCFRTSRALPQNMAPHAGVWPSLPRGQGSPSINFVQASRRTRLFPRGATSASAGQRGARQPLAWSWAGLRSQCHWPGQGCRSLDTDSFLPLHASDPGSVSNLTYHGTLCESHPLASVSSSVK